MAYVVAGLSLSGIWQLKKVQGTARHERMWVWVVLVLNVMMAAGSVAVFGYATSVQAGDATWKTYKDASAPNQEHTRETWACEINKFFPREGWAGSVCGTTQAMRYLLLAMALAAICVLGSLWVIVRSRGGIKWVSGGKGRYAGFRGMYEMQSQGPQAPYGGPPAGQWNQQPVQQWPMQPAQHGGPGYQPVPQWPQQVVQMPKSDAHAEQRPVFQ